MSDLNFEGLSDKQFRLFAARCARRVQHLMRDPRSIKALDVAEHYAHGQATDEELRAAQVAAVAAARDAGWSATDAAEAARAAKDVAGAAARDAARAVMDAAEVALTAAETATAASWVGACRRAATDAAETARAAAGQAAWAAELAEQQKILDEIRKEQMQ